MTSPPPAPIELDLARHFAALTERERKARRRSLLYTLVPVVLGGLWLAYSWTVVSAADRRVERAMLHAAAEEQKAALAQARKAEMDSALAEAQRQFAAVQARTDSILKVLATLNASGSAAASRPAIATAIEQTREIRSTASSGDAQVRAARLQPLVQALFGRNASERQRAYATIDREFRNDPQAVDALLNSARENMSNPHGIYNTVVTLKALSRTVTRPRRDDISALCDRIGTGEAVRKTAAECASLLAGIDTPR
jgi:hypothetical protein